MIQDDKQLLLKDLSARLPYHCQVFYEYVDDLDNKTYGYSLTLDTWCIDEFVASKAVVKPYLRSMNSMTEEEKDTYDTLTMCNAPWVVVNWLNANKFDYLGLISMGLAIAVTKENNPYKE